MDWEGIPMSKGMLKSIHVAIKLCSGVGSSMANPKIKVSDFDSHLHAAMNVGHTAQLLSGTMEGMIDKVCNNPDQHPMPETCPPGTDRVALFSKIRQLCKHMNRWFDVCNGKDKFNPFAKATKTTGPGCADELLKILAWFTEWDRWLRAQPGDCQADKFLMVESFRSLKSICYGFAAVVHEFCEREDRVINLSKINQDINKKHFGDVRQEAGGTDNPLQAQAMGCVDKSMVARMGFLDEGNCSNNPAEQRTTVPLKKQATGKKKPLKKRASAGNRWKFL
jgi:hypothetical protein